MNDFSNIKYENFHLLTFDKGKKKLIKPTKIGKIEKSDILNVDSIHFVPFEENKIVLKDIDAFKDTIFINSSYVKLDDIILKSKPIEKIGKINARGINYTFGFNLTSLIRIKIDSNILGKKIVSFNFYYKNIKSNQFENNNAELNVVIFQTDDIDKDENENEKFIQYVKLSENKNSKMDWVKIDLKEFDIYINDKEYIYFGIQNISNKFSTKGINSNKLSNLSHCTKYYTHFSNLNKWSCGMSTIPSYYIEVQ